MRDERTSDLLDWILTRKGSGSVDALHEKARELGLSDAERDLILNLPMALALGARQGDRPSATTLTRVQTSLGRSGRYGKFADRIGRLYEISTDEAEAVLARVNDPSVWVPSGIPGIDLFPIPSPLASDGTAVIARLQGGVVFPEHEHLGPETTFVLDGGFRDMSGVEIERGDELSMDLGSVHHFTVFDAEPCLAASYVRGGVKFGA
jgi:hypothetical protein